ncbi:hypothetical protein MUK42_13270 [Musa troglodytarum]|uniref:Uncharacterized protein n=1 Tax=Musa troglodytarum TaxID=320322 RepID=A0A9E7HTZ3_9LILI|nr:hypothetical protein MUK42_13270 [Musa troglodytarum]
MNVCRMSSLLDLLCITQPVGIAAACLMFLQVLGDRFSKRYFACLLLQLYMDIQLRTAEMRIGINELNEQLP